MRLNFLMIFLLMIASLLGSNASSHPQNVPQTNVNVSEVNLSYGLLVDNSGSVRPQLKNIVNASKSIVSANRQADETFIVRFVSQDNIRVWQAITRDKDTLISSLNNLYIEGGQTSLIDALYLSVGYFDKNADKNDRRKAIILVTDGDEGKSYHKLDSVLTMLRVRKLPIYIIGFTESVKKDLGSKKYLQAVSLLNTLAKETGGSVYFPKSEADWQTSINEIFESMRKL